jgi:hypothetical protein
MQTGGEALVWLIVLVAGLWLIVYTAVRAAVGHALDRVKPRLLAEARTTDEGVDFTITNASTAPAFDVSVRWRGGREEDALAHAPMLGLNGRLEWTLPAEPVPGEVQKIRVLELDWVSGLDPAAPRESTRRAVLVPSRLDAPR